MRKSFAFLACAAALALAGPAVAATVTPLAPGVMTNTTFPLDAVADFEGIVSTTLPGNSNPQAPLPFVSGGASFSGSPILMTGSSGGLYAAPAGDTTQYLSVRPAGNVVNVSFPGIFTRLGLYWGSIDTYNSIEFWRGGVLRDTVTGSQAAGSIPATAQGNQTSDLNNRYFIISLIGDLLGFDSIVLRSTQNSFELDNLSYGGPLGGQNPVPLPAALPLLAGGLGMLGFLGWRRKRNAVTA